MKKIRCGFAQVDITPLPNESFQDGYGSRLLPPDAVRSKIYAKVCAITENLEGGKTHIIGAFDICGFNSKVSDILRDSVKYYCGIDRRDITICATHTHTGPACGVLDSMPLNLIYWYRTAEAFAKAAKEALDNRAEGNFEFRISDIELKTIYNRVGRPYTDRLVRIGAFYDNNKALKGIIATGSCHPTVLGDQLISADYPGVMTTNLRVEYPGVPVLYLQGRGADTNPNYRDKLPADYLVNKLGTELSDSISDAVDKIDCDLFTDKEYNIKSAYKEAIIPRKPYYDEAAIENMIADSYKKYFDASEPVTKRCIFVEIEWLKLMRSRIKAEIAPEIECPIQALSLNDDIIFTFVPFELLCMTGNTIENYLAQKGYKKESTFVIGYANQVLSYLAPKNVFDDGGYDIGGTAGAASHWYMLPDCSKETEPAVLKELFGLVDSLK
ncbi:MAG: hypothetical protein VB118_12895 [Oscillospiraceae bacterium]|nr:hypothetical protein [Oscillospiraceae bacterium]